MAYAGNIIIQTKLDNKEFDKNLDALNKKIKKIDFKNFKELNKNFDSLNKNLNKIYLRNLTEMRKEVNLCQNALKKMVDHLRSFNSVRLDTQKFNSISQKTQEASKSLGVLDKNMLTLINRINTLNTNPITKLKTDLSTLSKLNFNNLEKAVNSVQELKSASNGLGISNNIKEALTLTKKSIKKGESGYVENLKDAYQVSVQQMPKDMQLFTVDDIIKDNEKAIKEKVLTLTDYGVYGYRENIK